MGRRLKNLLLNCQRSSPKSGCKFLKKEKNMTITEIIREIEKLEGNVADLEIVEIDLDEIFPRMAD